MAIYVGVNGVPKKTKAMYVGVNGTPKRVKTVYSSENGTLKKVLRTATVTTETVLKGTQVFTSSGSFTVPSDCTQVTAFVVGGGGTTICAWGDGWGGGGGYTNTGVVTASPGQAISVTIGSCASPFSYESSHKAGSSSVGNISAGGGWGSNGGSGGGAACDSNYSVGTSYGAAGGSNGSSGHKAILSFNGTNKVNENSVNAGQGQGTTTRAFGESSGTLYAGGGGGGIIQTFGTVAAGSGGAGGGGNGGAHSSDPSVTINPTSAAANTGGGGGGGSTQFTNQAWGASGIAIVRWYGTKTTTTWS